MSKIILRCALPAGLVENLKALGRLALPLFLGLLISSVGCKTPVCPDLDRTTGDLDDSEPLRPCTSNQIVFSPIALDLNMLPFMADDAGVGDTVRISVFVGTAEGSARALVGLDVYECGINGADQNTPGIQLENETPSLAPGRCEGVSATRIHCLTDDNGRASFLLGITQPAAAGGLCAGDSTVGSRLNITASVLDASSAGGSP